MTSQPSQAIEDSPQQRFRHGIIAALSCYLIWGVFPVYFKIMSEVAALEMLAHRIIWSVPFGAAIVLARRQWPEVRRALTDLRTLGFLALSSFFIAINWWIYVVAVQSGQIFQASLGYYINPLMYVVIGVLFFGERLRGKQVIAVVLAAAGVTVLTVSGGHFPMLAMILAVCFTAYGVIRKQVVVGAMPGLFIEVLLLVPIAGIYMLWLTAQGAAALATANLPTVIGLFLAGPLTVLPLLAFALAARRLDLSMLGFLQFITPTLQFLVGLAYGEVLTLPHAICFTLIWLAVSLFILDAWRARRALRPARA